MKPKSIKGAKRERKGKNQKDLDTRIAEVNLFIEARSSCTRSSLTPMNIDTGIRLSSVDLSQYRKLDLETTNLDT